MDDAKLEVVQADVAEQNEYKPRPIGCRENENDKIHSYFAACLAFICTSFGVAYEILPIAIEIKDADQLLAMKEFIMEYSMQFWVLPVCSYYFIGTLKRRWVLGYLLIW